MNYETDREITEIDDGELDLVNGGFLNVNFVALQNNVGSVTSVNLGLNIGIGQLNI